MYKKLPFIFIIIFTITNLSFASTHTKKINKSHQKFCCTPTKSTHIPLTEKPIEYAHYNNITVQEGYFPNDFINKIILKGKITDKNCVPIPNVRITVSQQDEYGIYRFVKAFVPIFEKTYKLNYQQYSTFSGTGTATSNNRGEFAFITTIPKSRTRNLDHTINIVTEHTNYPDIAAKILLSTQSEQKKLKHQNDFIFAQDTCTTEMLDEQDLPIYTIDLVLDGLSQYKRY